MLVVSNAYGNSGTFFCKYSSDLLLMLHPFSQGAVADIRILLNFTPLIWRFIPYGVVQDWSLPRIESDYPVNHLEKKKGSSLYQNSGMFL